MKPLDLIQKGKIGLMIAIKRFDLGFEIGDIIIGVNGQSITGLEGFIQLVSSLRTNQQIMLLAIDHRIGNI